MVMVTQTMEANQTQGWRMNSFYSNEYTMLDCNQVSYCLLFILLRPTKTYLTLS